MTAGAASFEGNVVLITGGSSGIGAAIADAFIAAGASVAICARSQPALDAFAARQPSALVIRADVTESGDRILMLEQVAARFGRIDILVNNAGALIERDFTGPEDPCDGLDREIALNLTAPIALTAAVLQRWRSLRAVILVSSGYALVSPRRAPTYGAAKAGLHGFAEALRRQLAGAPTQVVEVLPPAVDTPATAGSSAVKIPATAVASATLAALRTGRTMVLPGQMRFLPLLLRLAPQGIARIVAAT